MLERIDGKYLLVLGFHGAKVADPAAALKTLRESFPTVEIQLLRSDRVAGEEHLSFSARNALRAFSQHYERSRTLAMEVLVFASCQRQISRAIATLGLTAGTRGVALVAFSSSQAAFNGLAEAIQRLTGGVLDAEVLSIGTHRKLEQLKRVYRIGTFELDVSRTQDESDKEAVKRLVIERSALLALEG